MARYEWILLLWAFLLVITGALSCAMPNFQNLFGLWCKAHYQPLFALFITVLFAGFVYSELCAKNHKTN
jgi:uncharacterized membrane protein HdeD (DUF308 family)